MLGVVNIGCERNALSLGGVNREKVGELRQSVGARTARGNAGIGVADFAAGRAGQRQGREMASVADCERGDDFLLVYFVGFVADAFAYRVGKRVGILSYGRHGAKFKPLVVVERNEVDFFFEIAAFQVREHLETELVCRGDDSVGTEFVDGAVEYVYIVIHQREVDDFGRDGRAFQRLHKAGGTVGFDGVEVEILVGNVDEKQSFATFFEKMLGCSETALFVVVDYCVESLVYIAEKLNDFYAVLFCDVDYGLVAVAGRNEKYCRNAVCNERTETLFLVGRIFGTESDDEFHSV